MKLRFEFARSRRTKSWLLALLLGGLALDGIILQQYLLRLEQTRGLQVKLAALDRTEAATTAPDPEEATNIQVRLKDAQAVADQLNLPWGELLAELAKLCDKDVVLLSVEPDAGGSTLRVAAEARHTDAMFAFLNRAANSSVIRGMHLVQHHQVKEDPMQPIRFEVLGRW